MTKDSQPVITKGVRKTPKKTVKPLNQPRVPKVPARKPIRKKTGGKLVGNSKQKFDEIPDSMSQFSKITGNRSKHLKSNPKVEKKLTEKTD